MSVVGHGDARACWNACRNRWSHDECRLAKDLCGHGPELPGPRFVRCMTQNLNQNATSDPQLAIREAASICSRPLATKF